MEIMRLFLGLDAVESNTGDDFDGPQRDFDDPKNPSKRPRTSDAPVPSSSNRKTRSSDRQPRVKLEKLDIDDLVQDVEGDDGEEKTSQIANEVKDHSSEDEFDDDRGDWGGGDDDDDDGGEGHFEDEGMADPFDAEEGDEEVRILGEIGSRTED